MITRMFPRYDFSSTSDHCFERFEFDWNLTGYSSCMQLCNELSFLTACGFLINFMRSLNCYYTLSQIFSLSASLFWKQQRWIPPNRNRPNPAIDQITQNMTPQNSLRFSTLISSEISHPSHIDLNGLYRWIKGESFSVKKLLGLRRWG